MYRGQTVSARLLHAFRGFYENLGGSDFASLMRDCRLEAIVSQPFDADIDFTSFLTVLETASLKLRRDDLGLEFASRMPLRAPGIYHYLINNAPDLREQFISGSKYLGLVTNAYTGSYQETATHGWVSLNFRTDTGSRNQFVDLQAGAIVFRLRKTIDDDTLPVRVELERPKPKAIKTFEALLGDDLHFDAGANRIGLTRANLMRPVPNADPDLFAELQRIGDLLLKLKASDGDIVTSLSEYIASALSKGTATAGDAAKALGLSQRSMQRALAGANTSFSRLVEDTRRRTARHYLADTRLPLTEVAFRLGFAELSSFSRAAKSWFGVSPSAMRKLQHDEDAGAI